MKSRSAHGTLLRFWQRQKVTVLNILGLAFLGFLVRLIFFFQEFTLLQQLMAFFTSILVITFLWSVLNWYHHWLNHRLSYEKELLPRLVVEIGGGLVFVFAFLTLILYLFASRAPVPVEKPVMVTAYLIYTLIILVINAGFIGSHFFTAWKKSLVRAERLEKEVAVVRLENLINQVNPHFLFNSLTSLNSLIFEDQQLASQFLQQLAKVYRYVLQNKERELVPLSTEVAFIQSYLFLLQTRFAEGISFQVELPPASLRKEIVPLTLQILIENAIKHNVVQLDRPLCIRITADEQYLEVANNLQRKSIVETSNQSGLKNLASLYKYLSPEKVEVVETEEAFRVRVPLV
ncbi:hypothetical protein BH24BAC1_BH24BAC1_30170 [soil metagenome]